MKYHEAIDMILDGGEAYEKTMYEEDFRIIYSPWEDKVLFKKSRGKFFLCESMIKSALWIVEKDGVVYEKYTPSIKLGFSDKINIDVTLPRAVVDATEIKFKFNKPATVTFHYPVNLQEESKMPSQDEDWLEKKMICFMRRSRSWGTFAPSKKQESRFSESCADIECSSCFPNHIADVGDMVEQPSEKVTVRDIEKLVLNYCDAFYVFRNCDSIMATEKETLMRLAKHYLIREIEYLVSLQEKVK